MINSRIIGCCLIITFLLGGCSQRLQIEEALQEGDRKLTGEDLRKTLTDATIYLTSWDELYEAEIKLSADGRLKAQNDQGERDKGTWKLTDDDRFCFAFKKWLPDEMTCYQITGNSHHYQLFGKTGGYEFALEITEEGSPEALLEPRRTGQSSEAGNAETSWYSFLVPDGDDNKDKSLKTGSRRLLEDKKCVSCDLRGEDFAGMDLSNADLENAILTGADLSGTNLTGSNLTGADLSGADLNRADLRDAVLKDTILTGADLEMALLEEADLEGADLSNARMVEAVLDGANLVRVNLKGAELHWASLKGANLKEADLENAYLVKADFRGADLTGASLDNAVIQRTDFRGAKGYNSSKQESAAEENNSGWWFF